MTNRNDTREPWQIEHSLLCQIASSYLGDLDAARGDPHQAAVLAWVYNVSNGGFEQWARERIENAIRKANKILATHGGKVITAPRVSACLLARLAGMGLCGVANVADTSRTDGDATS